MGAVTQHEGRRGPRWAWCDGFQVKHNDRPYLDRLRLVETPWFGVFLHRIHQIDTTPPHDHPWWFASLVLSGGYTESVWSTQGDVLSPDHVVRVRDRWSLRSLNRSRAHTITHITGTLWTLVLVGRHCQDSWRFWAPMPVPWREYVVQHGDLLTEEEALWSR